MDIKYELEILRRNLKAKRDEFDKVRTLQQQELNRLQGKHILELQQFLKENVGAEREKYAGILNLQALAINEIKGRYILELQRLSSEIEQCSKRVYDFCKMVECYSCFDSKEIGEVLAEILSTLKGQEYIYQETLRYTSKVDENGKRVPLVIPYRIIIEKKLVHDSYFDDNISLDEIIKGNMAVILGINQSKSQMCLYKADEEHYTLNSLVDLRVPELIEFIEFLIEYKIMNKLEIISSDKMNELKEGFIKSKQIKDEKELVK